MEGACARDERVGPVDGTVEVDEEPGDARERWVELSRRPIGLGRRPGLLRRRGAGEQGGLPFRERRFERSKVGQGLGAALDLRE